MKNLLSIGSMAVGSVALAVNLLQVQPAQAVSLVQNGGFAPSATQTQSAYLGNSLKAGKTQFTIPNWTTNGYNFLVPNGTAFSTNLDASGYSADGNLNLYGNSGQSVTAPGGSGWYIAADGAYKQDAISQTLTGLTQGKNYTVTFFQAAGQQYDATKLNEYVGATTDRWKVSFGGSNQLSNLITPPLVSVLESDGQTRQRTPVTPWQQQSMTFTADGITDVLSFLAVGTPDGLPPFSLLAGITVEPTPVPEPFTIVGTLVGLGFGAGLRSKLAKKK
jgi:hypothetical protein